jgi:peptidoglycan/xylan/chitin deacetylase (PgdA/CDA1 family)
MPDLYRPASETEVLAAFRNPGVDLGSHTRSHVNLVSIGRAEAEAELTGAIRWLNEVGGSTGVISYPYGSWDPKLKSLVQAAGHRMGLLIRGGGFPASSAQADPFAVPRINVPRGISLDGFLLRVSGLWRN